MDTQQQPERKTKYTPAHKRLMDQWRENNREQFNALCRKASAVYYEKNREKKNKANLERYYKKKAEKLRLQENTADSPILSI
jgi:hypothetical protein